MPTGMGATRINGCSFIASPYWVNTCSKLTKSARKWRWIWLRCIYLLTLSKDFPTEFTITLIIFFLLMSGMSSNSAIFLNYLHQWLPWQLIILTNEILSIRVFKTLIFYVAFHLFGEVS